MMRSVYRFLPTTSVSCAVGLALGLSLLPTLARAQSPDTKGVLAPKGPLPYRNSEPLNTPFLLPLATDARVLGTGRGRFDLNIDVVNNLLTLDQNAPKRYLIDFEEQRFYFGYARGIGNRQEIGARLLYVSRNGGILENVIDGWHKLFGFKGGGRDQFPTGRTLFEINNADGQTIIKDDHSRSGLGDALLEYRYALAPLPDDAIHTRQIALAARALVKLPTGKKEYLLGSGKMDAGLGLTATARPLRNLALHGNVSVVFLGKPNNEGMKSYRNATHSLLAAEYLFDGRTSALFQTDDSPAPVQSGLTYADRRRRSFTFGLWRDIGHSRQIYILNSENDFGFLAKNAPDFVLSLGTRWLLR